MTSPSPTHPANEKLRARFQPRLRAGVAEVLSPDDVARPYESLGTHPDLVARLWDELGGCLPADCRRIFCGTPALMHPVTGIVFGFAGGTHTYALRLPDATRAAALAAGAERLKTYPVNQPSFNLDDIGPEWVFGRWKSDEPAWCLAAYEFAGIA